MPAAVPVTWYFDPISPFAYLALGKVEALAARNPVRYRPIVFGAVLSHWGQLGPAEIPPKRIHTYRHCQFMAEQAGIPFRFPPSHPFRSLDALRLLAALNATPQATRVVMDFIWAEGRDPAEERDELTRRLTARPFDALIDETGAKAMLHAWTAEAVTAGVFGVPTLAVGADLFWGADALTMAEARMADPALLHTAEMRRLAELPSTASRRVRAPS